MTGRSGIITLLTDFGLTDAYTAMMKGVILSINKNAKIVDITHGINVGSIFQGSGILKETYSYFPQGTVHIAVVDPGVGSSRRLIALKAGGHFFTGPDNGLFTPIIKSNKDTEIIELTNTSYFLPDVTNTFHGRDVFSPVAAHISLGTELSMMGKPISDPEKLTLPQPYMKEDVLTGQIIRIDNFGNLITNITSDDIKDLLNGGEKSVKIGDYRVKGISNTYSDIDKGELLALINSSNHLEIAVNLGKASEYTGRAQDDIIGMRVTVKTIN